MESTMTFEDLDKENLATSYNDHFDVVRVTTPAQLDEAYRLRYQVYCVENPFENPTAHVNGREIDVDDDRSVHALLIHRRTGITAGTVRVILPAESAQLRPLPIHLITQTGLLGDLPHRETGEISRFAVSKEFRCRWGENRYADIGFSRETPAVVNERRLVPYITFGLIRGVLEICLEFGVNYICAVMEPPLIRLLARIGLLFEPIGDPVQYHGLRQPCVARLTDLIERSRREHAVLWRYAGEMAFQTHDRVPSSIVPDVKRHANGILDRHPIGPPLALAQRCHGVEQERRAPSGVTATSLAERSAGGNCMPAEGRRSGRAVKAGFLKRQDALPVLVISQ